MWRFRSEVLRDYLTRGFHVVVVAPEDANTSEITNLGCLSIPLYMSRRGLNPFKDLWLFTQLLKIYLKNQPDFIFHYTIKPNIWGSLAAAIAGIPSIAVVTGLGHVFTKESLLTKIVALLYKLAFRSVNEIWFLNTQDFEDFVKRKITPRSKSRVLPSEGINLAAFSFVDEFPSQLTFLLASRMLWHKGVGEFVKAAELIKQTNKDVKFQLLGPIDLENPSGITLAQITAWQENGIVEYLGELTDVRPVLSESSCFVLPSYYREGVPRVLLEAAATGRPVITFDAPGCRETVIHGETGLLVPFRDFDGLVAAIRQVILMPSARLRQFGIAGRRLMESSFSVEKVLEQYRKQI